MMTATNNKVSSPLFEDSGTPYHAATLPRTICKATSKYLRAKLSAQESTRTVVQGVRSARGNSFPLSSASSGEGAEWNSQSYLELDYDISTDFFDENPKVESPKTPHKFRTILGKLKKKTSSVNLNVDNVMPHHTSTVAAARTVGSPVFAPSLRYSASDRALTSWAPNEADLNSPLNTSFSKPYITRLRSQSVTSATLTARGGGTESGRFPASSITISPSTTRARMPTDATSGSSFETISSWDHAVGLVTPPSPSTSLASQAPFIKLPRRDTVEFTSTLLALSDKLFDRPPSPVQSSSSTISRSVYPSPSRPAASHQAIKTTTAPRKARLSAGLPPPAFPPPARALPDPPLESLSDKSRTYNSQARLSSKDRNVKRLSLILQTPCPQQRKTRATTGLVRKTSIRRSETGGGGAIVGRSSSRVKPRAVLPRLAGVKRTPSKTQKMGTVKWGARAKKPQEEAGLTLLVTNEEGATSSGLMTAPLPVSFPPLPVPTVVQEASTSVHSAPAAQISSSSEPIVSLESNVALLDLTPRSSSPSSILSSTELPYATEHSSPVPDAAAAAPANPLTPGRVSSKGNLHIVATAKMPSDQHVLSLPSVPSCPKRESNVDSNSRSMHPFRFSAIRPAAASLPRSTAFGDGSHHSSAPSLAGSIAFPDKRPRAVVHVAAGMSPTWSALRWSTLLGDLALASRIVIRTFDSDTLFYATMLESVTSSGEPDFSLVLSIGAWEAEPESPVVLPIASVQCEAPTTVEKVMRRCLGEQVLDLGVAY